MDREAGWWATIGNIGLPPLARVMGVGRQHELHEDYIEIDETQRETIRTRGGYAPGGLWGISIFHLTLTKLFALFCMAFFKH